MQWSKELGLQLQPRNRPSGTDNDTERIAGLKSTEKIGAGTGAWNSKHPPKWLVEFRRRIVALALQIANLRMQTNTAWWEGNFRGAWPIEEYFHLIDCESDMLVGLAQVTIFLEDC